MIQSETDDFLLRYARRLLRNNSEIVITILDAHKLTLSNAVIKKAFNDLKEQFPGSVKLIKPSKISSNLLSKYSFLLISYQAWNTLSQAGNSELNNIPSTLIINKKVSRFHVGARNKIVSNESE